MTDPQSPWIGLTVADRCASVRLLCLPAAGGGQAAYRSWPSQLAGVAEVAVLALPGRDTRTADPPLRRLPAAVVAAADGIAAWWAEDSRPVVIFGHSMGALLGYELIRERQRRGEELPAMLVASARRAPQLPYDAHRQRLDELTRADLIAHLRRRGGTPDELLDPEVFEIFEPTLRADLELVETYYHLPAPALDTPVLTFRGVDDVDVSASEVAAWDQVTTAPVRHAVFPGNHFFHIRRPEAVLRLADEMLAIVALAG